MCRNDVNFIGDRWRKTSSMVAETMKLCHMPTCTDTASKVTKLTDIETRQCMGIEKENLEGTEPCEGIPLCMYHYGKLYRQLNPSHLKCTTCSKSIDPTKSRPIPEPALIQNFLSANTDFTGKISSVDRVCYACYHHTSL